jgi:hypothetical protein
MLSDFALERNMRRYNEESEVVAQAAVERTGLLATLGAGNGG